MIASAPIFCAWRASSIESSTASALTWIEVTGTRPATTFTAASAKRLRSAIVRLSDSPLWCGQEMAGGAGAHVKVEQPLERRRGRG